MGPVGGGWCIDSAGDKGACAGSRGGRECLVPCTVAAPVVPVWVLAGRQNADNSLAPKMNKKKNINMY